MRHFESVTKIDHEYHLMKIKERFFYWWKDG